MTATDEADSRDLAEILGLALRGISRWDSAARGGDSKAAADAAKVVDAARYRLRRLASRQAPR